MSNTRYLLGGAAILGASYYVYQQRLEQSRITAIEQDSLKNKLPGFGSGSSSTDPREGPGQHAGRKIDEAAYQARDKFDSLKDEANKKLDSQFAQAENEKARLANWTSQKISNAQDQLDHTVTSSKEKAEAFRKEVHKDDPKGLNKFGQDIKANAEDVKHKTESSLESAKDSVFGSLSSAKDSIIGSKNKAEDELNAGANKVKSTATDFKQQAESKADEASKQATSWFSSAKKDTQDSLESAQKTAEDKSRSFFSWGSSKKDDTKESIDAAYDEAQKIFDDAEKRYKETKSSWFSFNKDSKKKEIHEEAEKQLDAAQKNLDSASSKFKNWQSKATETIKDKADQLKPSNSRYDRDAGYDKANEFFTGELINRREGVPSKSGGLGFYDWLRGGSPSEEERLARGARQGLRGWGESAEQFSNDEYEEAQSLSGRPKEQKTWGIPGFFKSGSNKSEEQIASNARQGLRGWGENAAQFADDEVDEAKRQGLKGKVNEAKEKGAGIKDWFKSGSNKDEERIARDAKAGLKGWGENAAQFADDEADEVKRQATKAQEHYDAKLKEWNSWADKKYENSAKGAEDYYKDAQQSVENARKDLEANANHWWSWSKEKSAQFELDAKKNLEDAEKRLGDATSNLSKWGSDTAQSANLKFWSSADDAIHQAKAGLDTANEKTQKGLSDAQSWVKDQKK